MKRKFKTSIMNSNPTINGNIYNTDVLHDILDSINAGKRIVIQELLEVERRLKNIPVSEPWKSREMGIVRSAEINSGELIVEFECFKNRYGTKLEGRIDSMGIGSVEFFPVGFGVEENGVIQRGYKLSYIAVELKSDDYVADIHGIAKT